MSAIASLLVATIMLVSTTYAWITLSQAPEATGLQTNITGNGSTQTGTIEHYQPYAHYAYEGIVYGPHMPVMQAGEVAGYYSRPKPERKQPTGAMMHYNGTGTRHWDQAAKPTKLPLLIRTLQSYVDKMDK